MPAIIYILFCCVFFNGSFTDSLFERGGEHAIYISVIQLKHQSSEQIASLNVRVFADDLINCLKHEFGYDAIIEQADFCGLYASEISRYFQKHLKININNQNSLIRLSAGQREADVFQLGFFMDCPSDWESFKLTADYFMELFPAQSNVLHLEEGLVKKFGRVNKGKEELRFLF